MSCRAKYREISSKIDNVAIGGLVRCPPAQETALRCAGYRVGKVFILVSRTAETVTLRRVKQTGWGVRKARVSALEIGQSLSASTMSEVHSLYKGGLYAGLKLSYRTLEDGTFLVTRTA